MLVERKLVKCKRDGKEVSGCPKWEETPPGKICKLCLISKKGKKRRMR
jgi:hypothetical protein